MKTAELTGAALDWAVAKCEGVGFCITRPDLLAQGIVSPLPYSTEWSQGGPIIEREEITVCWQGATWVGSKFNVRVTDEYEFHQTGPAPLIAAMRCYVASKLGIEIEIPKEVTVWSTFN